MKKKPLTIWLMLILLLFSCFSFASAEEDGENLIYNADFSISSDQAQMPSGWSFSSYAGSASATLLEDDGLRMLCISADMQDDARAYQDVKVLPDTAYVFSAVVATEDVAGGQGANLCIDNYAIDGTYCYSEALYGNEDAQTLTLYFYTGAEQDTVRVALRLGGYGMESSGTAVFYDVSLVQTDGEDAYGFVDLASAGGTSGGVEDEAVFSDLSGSAVFTAMLLCTLFILVFGAIIYLYVIRDEGVMFPAVMEKRRYVLAVILTGAFLLRVLLSVIFYGHTYDMNCFMAWGNAVAQNGTSTFYTSGMFADYPPGYMYICGLLSLIADAFGFSYGSTGMALLYKMPATIADMLMALLVYRISKNQGLRDSYRLWLVALVAFNPATAFVSGAWGQVESILMLLLCAAFYCLLEGYPIAGGLVYAAAILLKPQALMFGPILAVAYFVEIYRAADRKKQLLRTAAAVASAFALLLLASIPFKGTQEFGWLVKKLLSTSTSYAYASVEAFNFPALLGDNWAPVTSTVLGIPYTVWGPIFIGIGLIYGAFLVVYANRNRNAAAPKGTLYLAASAMMCIIFSFGYYMHERYLMPVLFMLLLAYLYEKDRRIIVCLLLATAAMFLNSVAAMYIVDHQALRWESYDIIVYTGSVLSLLCCCATCYVSFDLLVRGSRLKPVAREESYESMMRSPMSAEQTHGMKRKEKILPQLPTDMSLLFSRKDVILVTLLTVVYGVVAVLNLGSLSAPQTYWEASAVGETVTISLGEEREVGSYSVFGNIADGGELLLRAGEHEEIYTQSYDQMFRWDVNEAEFTASTVTLTLYAGAVKINELAFFDTDGNLIPASVVNPEGSQQCLMDEQDTVPESPSYYNGMYFDELYHGRTAYEHLHNLTPYENSHPPLGKLIIAIGIAIFGMCPFGWRIMGALFGIAMLPLLYAFGKRLMKSTEHAFLLSALFAFDFMHFTQTRIATIDVYAVFFILLMYYFMYEYIQMNFFTDSLGRTFRPLALCGIAFGLGCASKWICIYAGGGLALLFFGSLIRRWAEYRSVLQQEKAPGGYHGAMAAFLRLLDLPCEYAAAPKERRQVRDFWDKALKTCLFCCVFFIVVPFAIYFASYIPYYVYYGADTPSSMLSTWSEYQNFMWSYHSGLNATHPYQSSWYQWPFTNRPMWYYCGNDYEKGIVSTLTASGSPAVWWVSTIGAVALFILRLTGKVEKDRAMQVFCIGVLANYLPWVLVSRCTFIYHFFATVPFILMATVYLEKKLEEKWKLPAWVKWLWLGIAVALFILLYPGLSGYPVSASWAAFIKKLPGGHLMYGA